MSLTKSRKPLGARRCRDSGHELRRLHRFGQDRRYAAAHQARLVFRPDGPGDDYHWNAADPAGGLKSSEKSVTAAGRHLHVGHDDGWPLANSQRKALEGIARREDLEASLPKGLRQQREPSAVAFDHEDQPSRRDRAIGHDPVRVTDPIRSEIAPPTCIRAAGPHQGLN